VDFLVVFVADKPSDLGAQKLFARSVAVRTCFQRAVWHCGIFVMFDTLRAKDVAAWDHHPPLVDIVLAKLVHAYDTLDIILCDGLLVQGRTQPFVSTIKIRVGNWA
jgi:hypothetical protein